ncbi:X-Pro dipeptidyl-peptidase [Sphaerisporangium melleum]|uniref:X-Pro dipeptidyl-peptidase n=1 Tax=Sphaerisporangium melleum TaxID=321316 RepID=A0A917R5M3_9ACTN|nr:CocE/NonD family hydrolase [Sphaerisporangium melleum]GGK90700.1 X-Pro dipeptidyl-peptidase [Sphaerisporangium melleum]GII72831.1 X-Pro dipeptidyl-peptidase [Sphaerisporangium melleum]
MPKLDIRPLLVVVEHDIPMPMRDGTVLRGSVHRPAEDGPFPALLVRSPYGEDSFQGTPLLPMLRAGYAVVLQHCRGRGTSDGEFRPWLDEGADGYDTIAWIGRQPWSNGEVVMSGMSYLAGCALQAAATRPPGLRSVVAAMTPHDFHDGLKYHGGAFALGSALNWGAVQAMLGLAHATAAGEDVTAEAGVVLAVLGDQETAARTLPLSAVPGIPWWQEWTAHPERDAYWEEAAQTLRHDRIEVPVMHIGGWFDLFLAGTLENHRRLGGPLVIGPWSHLSPRAPAAGRLYFGASASAQAIELEQRQLAFLRGEDTGPAVKLFVMGDDTWRDEEAWPLARAVETRYHLHADGSLSTEPPRGDEPATFTFDPRDPVPTVGGPVMLGDPANVGPQDQRDVETRADVLCYTTGTLGSDVEVTGPVTVTLHAETSATATDWTAKLVNVHPDGRAMSVTDGIVRATEPSGTFLVDLVATSQVFKAGHRIRVEISSSNFPRFDRNPGTGRPATEADLVAQHQKVFPRSFITLPIVPR